MVRPELLAPQAIPASSARVARPPRTAGWFNPLRRQPPAYSPLPPSAIVAAAREAASNDTDALGRLEGLLRREYAADRVILFASGTMALQIGIRAAIDKVGAEALVALPAFTCYDVATAAVGADARIALYDIDPETLQPDLGSLDAALRDGAGAVVIAHQFGVPVDWRAVETLTAARGAVIIEDAAQGHGGHWHGQRLGGLGTISVLSFGRGKGWTGGGGGALLLRSGSGALDLEAPATSHVRRDSSMWLRVSAQSALGRPAIYGLPATIPWLGLGETYYRAPVEPEGMRRFTAALLMHSRAAAEREAERRRRNGQELSGALAGLRGVAAVRADGINANRGFLRFPARVTGGLAGLETHHRLTRLGVTPSYPQTLDSLTPVASRLARAGHRFAGAETLVRELVTIPTHSLLTDRDRQQVLWLLDSQKAAV